MSKTGHFQSEDPKWVYLGYGERNEQNTILLLLFLKLLDLPSTWVQVDILKGYCSEKFDLKGSLFRKVLSRRVIIPKIFIPEGHYSKTQNNDPSG